MKLQQSLTNTINKLNINSLKRQEVEQLFYKMITLNIMDQLHNLTTKEQRDRLISLASLEKDELIKKTDINNLISSLKRIGINSETAEDIIEKAQTFALKAIDS